MSVPIHMPPRCDKAMSSDSAGTQVELVARVIYAHVHTSLLLDYSCCLTLLCARPSARCRRCLYLVPISLVLSYCLKLVHILTTISRHDTTTSHDLMSYIMVHDLAG